MKGQDIVECNSRIQFQSAKLFPPTIDVTSILGSQVLDEAGLAITSIDSRSDYKSIDMIYKPVPSAVFKQIK